MDFFLPKDTTVRPVQQYRLQCPYPKTPGGKELN